MQNAKIVGSDRANFFIRAGASRFHDATFDPEEESLFPPLKGRMVVAPLASTPGNWLMRRSASAKKVDRLSGSGTSWCRTRVFGDWQGNLHGQDVLRIESSIDTLQTQKALHEKACSHEKDQSKSDLGHDH